MICAQPVVGSNPRKVNGVAGKASDLNSLLSSNKVSLLPGSKLHDPVQGLIMWIINPVQGLWNIGYVEITDLGAPHDNINSGVYRFCGDKSTTPYRGE